MRKHRHNQDIHHIVWQCNKERCNVNDGDNKMIIRKTVHEWLNALFQHNQSPHEQLKQLRDMYEPVLSDTAKQIFDDLLELPREYFYKSKLIK